MAFPGALQIVVAGFTAPLAGLLMAASGWGSEAALAAATLAVVTMLAATVALAAADWSDEIKHRKAWAAIDIVADDHAISAAVRTPVERDRLYPPVANADALYAILRAHRHAAPPNAGRPVIDIGSKPLPPTVAPVAGTAAGFVRDAIASDTVGTARRPLHKAQEALCVPTAVGPTAVHSKPRQLKVMAANRRAAGRTRLAANEGPWAGRPGSRPQSALHTAPITIVSDIIIVGQGKRRQSDGERPPQAQPSGCVPSGRTSERTSVVASAADRRRPPAAIKSSQPEVCFEAQRQLIALAEALARQAAREDDAAERSCSPPDIPVEILPGGGAKEDTS